jgi:DNA recombination protein RmuC
MNSYPLVVSSLVLAIAVIVVAMIIGRAKSRAGSAISAEINPEQLLGPIREQIGVIVRRLDETSMALTETRTSISQELSNVLTVSQEVRGKNEELALTTERISTALQGTGVRGNWGQISLRRVAEMAGLSKHVLFSEQATTEDEEGKIIPDMVVLLPGGRRVVVDAKAPKIDLKGKKFSTAILLKNHINDLEKRKYGERYPGAVDFTVLFVPAEGQLSTALEEDQALSEYAFERKILLATPMTLLALLKAVEFGWKQSDQMDNVNKILQEAKILCERFGVIGEFFERVGESLNSAVIAYNESIGSFNERLKPQIRKIGDMGVDVKRSQRDFPEIGSNLKN